MIIVGSFLVAVGGLLSFAINFYYWLLIARCILSFVSPDPRNPIVLFINDATEPVLSKVRSKIPPLGVFDLSPLVVLAGLMFIDSFLVGSLMRYGEYFRSVQPML
jgi:YggT family protein